MNDFLDGRYSCLTATKAPINHFTSLKHAFVLSFYFLLRAHTEALNPFYFQKSLSETVKLGGDTNANASAVAGMMGALLGLGQIPRSMISTMVAFKDEGGNGQNREGRFLVSESLLAKIDRLIEVRPKAKLVVKKYVLE